MRNTDGTLAKKSLAVDLPSDLEGAHKLITELFAACEELKKENQDAKWQIDLLLQRLYGRKSERHIDPNQLLLPGLEDATVESPEQEPEPLGHEEPFEKVPSKSENKKKARKKWLHGRGELPPHLERREHVVDVDESEKACKQCGTERKIIGYIRTERLDYDPPKLFVEVEVRPKYALDCDCDVEQPKIGADETPVQMNYRIEDPETNQTKIRTKQAYFWVYRGDDRAPFTLFDFQPTRGQSAPEAFLTDFHEGFFQTDGYAGYHSMTNRLGVTSVGCWAHARRKFKEAVLSSPLDAAQALVYIRELYTIEHDAKEQSLTPEYRRSLRIEKSSTILEKFHTWLLSTQNTPAALPKARSAKPSATH